MLNKSIRLLEKKDQKNVLLIVLVQLLLAFLDLAGVIAIGLVGALSISGIQSKKPGDRIEKVLSFFDVQDLTIQSQVAVVGGAAAGILILRTLLSLYFNRRILFFLSKKAADLSSKLIRNLLKKDLLFINARNSQETLYAVTTGVNLIMLNVVGSLVGVITDLFLLFLLTAGLFAIDTVIALCTLGIFSSVAVTLYFAVQQRANRLGQENADLNILSNQKILEVINSYRELLVRNRRKYYSNDISQSRYAIARNSAELAFIPSVSKYVIEITMVLGALLISSTQFLLKDAVHAISTLSVFLAAASRLAPAVLRIQSGAIAIRSSTGAVQHTFELIERIGNQFDDVDEDSPLDTQHIGFNQVVDIQEVNFRYPGAELFTISNINLQITSGEFVAIVGPSGAGKTTLVDLMLGVINPESGKINISGENPTDAIRKWPGAIGYIPQNIEIIDGSIKSNIALGFPESDYLDELFESAITISQMRDFILSLPRGLETEVGEKGSRISGGQRQRLGIARSLYTKPRILVMDEATSLLDGKTESNLTQAIQMLRGDVTLISIAHRLSTIISADKVVYMNNGRIEAVGTFQEVKSQIPDFEEQAHLMGL